MIIQYISDLHLELLNDEQISKMCDKIICKAPIMVLGGDIGNPYNLSYDAFLCNMSSKFEKIFIICGNHEYYYNNIDETKIQVRTVCNKYENIIFLDNEIYKYNGYTFVGTTLWSRINDKTNEINDTLCIKDITVQKYINMFNECIEFLTNTLPKHNNIIVISHHLPSLLLIHKKYKSAKYLPINQWFASDLDELLLSNNSRINGWIYGHTHTAMEINICGIDTFCNPVGYKNENHNINYCKLCNIDIKN